MKLILALSTLVMLVGCDGTQQTAMTTLDLKQVRGLEDCTYYVVDPGGTHNIVTVIRCPNSTTSTSYVQGKVPVLVIDGVEYVRRAD
jgi:hypothetical protein